MSDINEMYFTGKVCGHDAEIKESQKGSPYVRFSVSVSESVKKNGKYEMQNTFINCMWVGKYASSVGKSLTKGTPVTVIGSYKTSEYQGKTYSSCLCSNVIPSTHSDFIPKSDSNSNNVDYNGHIGSEEEQSFDSSDIPF